MLADHDLSLVRSFEKGPSTVCPFPTVTAAFYHYAANYGDAVAARDMSTSPMRELSYRELAREAQTLARNLRQLGVGPGQRVPLLVKRGLEMVVSIWAVLSCGAQYVPLDGGVVPESTIRTVLEQSGGVVVICVPSTEHRLKSLQGLGEVVPVVVEVREQDGTATLPERLLDLATAASGCYVIYTSGTTGKPKGVDVTHRNVANLVCQAPGNLGVRPGTSVGSILNISFDMAAWEIFTCMCNGGTLVMRGSKWEPTLHQINVLICTPTILSRYHPDTFPQIRTVATAGEASSQNLADLWASRATYWNSCGPTETTIVNTMCKHVVGQPLSIGRPTPNNTVYILDENLQHVAAGVPGTMWAGGHGISRGYVGLPQRTAESYRDDPFANDGSKMYNTGDLGSWMPDGQIEIIGRADDQVKVKGFRVELDGITSTIASFPGVTRATVLLIEGQLHAYVSPADLDVPSLITHVKRFQPYYAVPSSVHALPQLPSTANGKIDKKALAAKTKEDAAAHAAAAAAAKSPATESTVVFAEKEGVVDPEKALVLASVTESSTETRSVHSTTTTTTEGAKDLSAEIPDKRHGQPFRGLRHRLFIVYRRLLSIVWFVNLAALIALIATHGGPQWLAILTAANLVTCVLMRQDAFINLLYTVACSVPTSAPLWIRTRCAEIYHLGGVHSGAGICATVWLYISTIRSTTDLVSAGTPIGGKSLAVLILSWMLCALCGAIVAFAWPGFRKKYHNQFEQIHRFMGWTALVIFWVRLVLTIDDERSVTKKLGLALAESPIFWMLVVATLCIASSWFWLRRVPVESEVLSDHAVRLHFKYTTPVNGSFTRLSHRPLLEWHSFATIPNIESESGKGYSLIVSNAGDWTRTAIHSPATSIWVRGLPTCGVMRIATLFNRVVVIATGSGIGPVLGHINSPSCPTQLIWSTPTPEKTFGKGLCQSIRKSIPGAVIHDTRAQGRPDLVRMGYNMARSFGAEAVIIIANEKITKKVVYGLQTRGIPAYGAIWDS